MTLKTILAASAAAAALTGTALAQETTGALRGVVTDEAGSPLRGATVTVLDTQTGRSRTLTTDDEGYFSARNLSVGGSYTVTATADGYLSEAAQNLRLSLGNVQNLTFDLASGATDEIIVVAARQVVDVAAGPSRVFGLDTIQSVPAINRDIKDVLRIDPRVYIDETFADAIQCAGGNSRFNSLTVDGVRLNDNFGLNSNGYPTERIPFSFDSLQQVAVELAPYDVEYGFFTSCNINAVTKSGQNEFFGGAFYDFTSDELRGDKAEDFDVDNGDFTEMRYGFNVGGPIIKDKLFFFASYEKLEGANLFGDNTPEGKGITQAQFDEIVDIAANVYGYEVGPLPTSLDNEDEKILIKLDWNITDNHRAAFTWNYNDGFNNSESDGDPDELPEFKHFYERGAELNSYVGSFFSEWTDRLSTEFRIGYVDLDNRQTPLGGLDEWGQVEIDVTGPSGNETRVYLGADDSRHANQLNYELWTFKGKADYEIGNHLITAGVEREQFEVFNLFVQEVKGEWNFQGIENFRLGNFDEFEYENAAGSNDPNDGAAEFGYEVTTAYLQDVWQATADLRVTAGIRWDYYTSDDKPQANTNFQQEYGFPNNDNLDGKSVVQPRIALNWEPTSDLSVRAGVGIFSGGNPNVWISNNYSNNGVTLFSFQPDAGNVADFTYDDPRGVFFDVPNEGVAAVAAAEGRGPVNALDPDFEIPSELKASLGATYRFDTKYAWLGEDYQIDLDFLYSKARNPATVRNLELTQTATAPDGRPIYSGAPFNDFLLTNAEDEGRAFVLSAFLSKRYDFGLDWSAGYAYTDATDVNPMTSSVAFSNDKNYTTSDPLNPGTANSDYVIPHRFTFNVNYDVEFVRDYKTGFSVFGEIAEGGPRSYSFGRNRLFEGFYANDRQLFYVPETLNDPNVVYDSPETALALAEFIGNREELAEFRGEIAPRNEFNDDWYSKFDLTIRQDLPGIRPDHRTQAFFILENVGNFLNSDWGVRRQTGFPGNVPLVDVDINDQGQYVYSGFRGQDADEGAIQVGTSLWEVRFGVRYQF